MKQRNILMLIVFSILISCKEDESLFQIEGLYKSFINANVTPVIMYTKQGQVTSSTTIQDFLKRRGRLDAFILNSSSTSVTPNLLTLMIKQNNMATISTDYSITPLQGEIINQTSSELVIALMDSVRFSVLNGGINIMSMNRCDTLGTAIISIKTPKTYYPLSASTGVSSYYKLRQRFPIGIKNGQLFLPLMTSFISASNASGNRYCSSNLGDQWNSFNLNATGQLNTGDTIVYQIKEVLLLKQ